jgi:hypothetical protein
VVEMSMHPMHKGVCIFCWSKTLVLGDSLYEMWASLTLSCHWRPSLWFRIIIEASGCDNNTRTFCNPPTMPIVLTAMLSGVLFGATSCRIG